VSGFDRPRWERRDWLALAVYLVLAHLVFLPALRPGVFLYGRDTTAHDYGLLYYNWRMILDRGVVALWNPYLFCGIPSLGTLAFCPFYPLGWLFALVAFPLAFTYQYLLNDWLAGLWTYWAGRWMGLRRSAAFFAGAVFLASGHLVTLAHAGHLQKFAAIAWLPFVFGCATAAMKTGRLRYWVGCGVGVALQLLASHMQIAYYTVLFLVPWTIWSALGARGQRQEARGKRPEARGQRREVRGERQEVRGERREGREILFALGGLVLAAVVAVGLSAAQTLPLLETTPLSNRGGGVAFDVAAETSYPPLEFLEYLLPSFLGDSTGASPAYWGRWGSERIVTDYMGLLPLILFFYALAAGRGRDRWFWLGVVLLTALLAAGRYTPVFRWAFRWLPGLNRFRSPGTIMVFIAWPVAITAGLGLECFAQRAGGRERRRAYFFILAVAAVGCAGAAFLLSGPAEGSPLLRSFGLVAEAPKGPSPAATLYSSLRRSLLFSALSCGALALLAAGAGFAGKGRKIPWALSFSALIGLAFLDPRLHETRYIRALDVRPFHLYLFHHWSDPILRALPRPVRGIETGNELSNRMMTRGIASLHGYHPVHLQEYVDLLNLYAADHPKLGRLVFEQFILAPPDHPPGFEYYKRAQEKGQVLWLRRPPILYAYFPNEVKVLNGRREVLSAMGERGFDPYRCSYGLDKRLAYKSDGRSTASARVVAYSPGRVEIEVSATGERPMVVAEPAAPGWKFVLDGGKKLPTFTANYAFRATRVPAGVHKVALVYRPFSFRLGLYLTLCALAVLLGAWAAVLGRSRRLFVAGDNKVD